MTTIRYPGQLTLTAAQRGYKQPGKRLLPRDGYDAHEIIHYKLHGLRELDAQRRKEASAYDDEERTAYTRYKGDFDPFASAARKLKALSGRRRKLAEAMGYLNASPPQATPRSVLRVVEAMDQAQRIEACIHHDQMMLSNCK